MHRDRLERVVEESKDGNWMKCFERVAGHVKSLMR